MFYFIVALIVFVVFLVDEEGWHIGHNNQVYDMDKMNKDQFKVATGKMSKSEFKRKAKKGYYSMDIEEWKKTERI